MESPFKNDPFAVVYLAFKQLFPSKECEIWWDVSQDKPEDKEPLGYTDFPDDGGMPQVIVYAEFPVKDQVEILAHELAHVAVGPGHGHDEKWELALGAIQQRYERISSALFGRRCEIEKA